MVFKTIVVFEFVYFLSLQAVNKTARIVHRALDKQTRKHKVPEVDRTPIEPPPALVAVVGPPKCGKTTLIRSLVKHYTKQNVNQIKVIPQSLKYLAIAKSLNFFIEFSLFRTVFSRILYSLSDISSGPTDSGNRQEQALYLCGVS